jgi:hypothetical protein
VAGAVDGRHAAARQRVSTGPEGAAARSSEQDTHLGVRALRPAARRPRRAGYAAARGAGHRAGGEPREGRAAPLPQAEAGLGAGEPAPLRARAGRARGGRAARGGGRRWLPRGARTGCQGARAPGGARAGRARAARGAAATAGHGAERAPAHGLAHHPGAVHARHGRCAALPHGCVLPAGAEGHGHLDGARQARGREAQLRCREPQGLARHPERARASALRAGCGHG